MTSENHHATPTPTADLLTTARLRAAELRAASAEDRATSAESRLRHLETIIDTGDIGIFEWPDVTEDHASLSEPFLRSLGYDPAHFDDTRDALRGIIHPEDLPLVTDSFAAAVAQLARRRYTCRLRLADGSYRWHETNLKGSRRPGRAQPSVVATVVDVHEAALLRLNNAALVEQLNFVVKAAAAGVYDWPDVREPYVEIHPSLSELLGYGPGEWPNDIAFFWSLIHPEDAPTVEGDLEVAYADPAGRFDSTYRIRFKSAGYRYVRSMGHASAIDGGRSWRLTGALFDVHDAYLGKRRAAEAHEQLTQFSYVVAHDLVAPLRQLAGYTAILREDHGSTLEPAALRHLDTMEATAKNAQLLIRDLLEFGRLGTAALHFESVDLQPIVADLTLMLDPERSVAWRLDPLPRVTGDRTQLTMLFQNLIANAVKFSARGNRRPEVSILVGAASGDDVVITVADNGAGFDPGYAVMIFGAFERAHSRGEFEGTGIGLANVARIVERHGGSIRATGEVGVGASFVVTLPRGV